MNTTATGVLWREYLRVSYDRSGHLKSNGEQHSEHVEWVTRRGDRLHPKPYQDSVSASKYGTKSRDDFTRLVADIESGRFKADGLLLWESSRGSRKVSEWASLIEACEERNILIGVMSDGRVFDPANGRDVRDLLDDANDAQYESYKISKRIRRDRKASVVQGRPHSAPPYGYRPAYDGKTRKPVEPWWTVVDEEAAIVKESVKRFLAGEPIEAVARDLTERGVADQNGKPFSAQRLRYLIRNPAYASLRYYGGKDEELRARSEREGGIPGGWPAIISTADHYRVMEIVNRRKTVDRNIRNPKSGQGRRAYLLTGIAHCGVCGAPLSGKKRRKDTEDSAYVCLKGCVRMPVEDLDEFAEQTIFEFIRAKENAHFLSQKDDESNDEVRELTQQISKLRHRQAELSSLLADVDSPMSPTEIAQAVKVIKGRVTQLERRKAELSSPGRLASILGPSLTDTRRAWGKLTLPQRREAARLLLSEDMLGLLVVFKKTTPRNMKCPAHLRVGFRRSDGLTTAEQVAPVQSAP
ncbi:recombinase family protein [Amycolatopsis rhizosphaerae]|uniref:Recombinase family protein n=1 Tax=Amycolatopsis rhizosphaerae TaxID=2053003 RepID=A0A558CTQ6_9PSEU|nr:recombinase family protein [Amycolatopsis rhizosphaerae]TVT52133.1 recombinase family protein [Amycolatopsis rhizosphaerae]